MASPPVWLGKLNSLTDTFDVEISSDLDQRIPSSFGNKSWAIMTYLRAGPVSVGGSKSKCVIVRVTVLEQGHCSPRKLIHQGPWANTSRCFTGPAIGMFAHARQLQQNWKSSTKQSPHMFIKNCKLDLGITAIFVAGSSCITLLAKLAHEVKRLSPFELSESVGVINFIVIIMETLTLFLKMHL